MAVRPDIARLAAIIGEPARATMLLALLEAPALTASELATEARVTAQTASGHLRLMRELGLVSVDPKGRHRYFAIADDQVRNMLHQLENVSLSLGCIRSDEQPSREELRRLRTCHDHMAGKVAVDLYDRMRRNGLIEIEHDGPRLTTEGRKALMELGAQADRLTGRSRPLCATCDDWSEQKAHLAGQAGAALMTAFVRCRWIVQRGRVLVLTDEGEAALSWLFQAQGPGECG